MKLLAIAASHRKESINQKLVLAAAEFAQGQGATITHARYADFDAPPYNDEKFDEAALPDSVQHFIALLREADGVLLATPEYNWSFPGSLKNLIDWVSAIKACPFQGKPFMLMSASPSLRGGAQGLVQLQLPLSNLGAFVFPRLFTVSKGHELWNDAGMLTEPKIVADLAQTIDKFVQFAKRLG